MVLRIRALNETDSEEDSGDETDSGLTPSTADGPKKITKEAEEAHVHEKFREAMVKLAAEKKDDAKAIFEEILTSPILEEIDQHPDKRVALSGVYYATCKNLGMIAADVGHDEEAVQLFYKAVQVDDTDAMVWYKLGKHAFKTDDYLLCRSAFERCLNINPNFWPCVDNMISLLFIIGDHIVCLFYIERALENQEDYLRGLVIKDEIFRQNPILKEVTVDNFAKFANRNYNDDQAKQILGQLEPYVEKFFEGGKLRPFEAISPDFDLTEFNISSLGRALLRLDEQFKGSVEVVCSPIDLTRWLENVKNRNVDPMDIGETSTDATGEQTEAAEKVFVEDSVDTSRKRIRLSEPTDIFMGSSISDSDDDDCQILEPSEKRNDGVSVSSIQTDVQSSPLATSSLMSSPERNRRGRWKRKRGSRGDHNEFKRRSTRLIPGYYMEDPEAFGPLTTRPINVNQQLRSFMPAIFARGNDVDNDRQQSRDGDRRKNSSSSETNNEHGTLSADNSVTPADVLEFLETNNRRPAAYLMKQYLIFVQTRLECDYRWSELLRQTFMDCYERWSTRFPQFTNPARNEEPNLKEAINEQCREEGRIQLLYAELKVTKAKATKDIGILDDYSMIKLFGHLLFLAASRSIFDDDDEGAWVKFSCRVDWMNALVQTQRKNYGEALWNLTGCYAILDRIGLGRPIALEHCQTTITVAGVKNFMESLERAGLLDSVEEFYDRNDHQAVVDILTPHFVDDDSSNSDQMAQWDRFRQCEILLTCLRKLERIQETASTFVRAFKFGLLLYGRLAVEEKTKWYTTIGNLLSIGEWVFNDAFVATVVPKLDSSQRLTLANSLTEFISIMDECQLKKEDVAECCWLSPWIILYRVNRFLEMNSFDEAYATAWYEKASSSNIILATRSLMILWKGHEELGRKRLCMLRQGRLLVYLAEEIMNALRQPELTKYLQSSCVNDTLNVAEQCFYCLYKYPAKRKRHLEEHDATPIELNWTRAHLLFEFVKPDQPPEFDDHVHATGVSADSVQLLHRIETIVPRMLRPHAFEKQLDAYFDNPTDDFPELGPENAEPIISDLYHLLADYYLKTKDIEKAIQYYRLDLCVSSDRFDSWAGLAMAYGHVLSTLLNSMDLSYSEVTRKLVSQEAKVALYCFDRATMVRTDHYVLLVEYATVAYSVHSFFSRFLKHVVDTGSAKEKASLEFLRDKYRNRAHRVLLKANAAAPHSVNDDQNEEWIHNYLFGKVSEKRKAHHTKDPTTALRYYRVAAYNLHKDGAQYPEKIRYNVPQRYTLETLEVFYRVHACTVKWLIRGHVTGEMMKKVYNYVSLFRGSPLFGTSSASRSREASRLLADPDVVDCIDSLLDEAEITEGVNSTDDLMDTMRLKVKLIRWCNEAFQLCVRRFSNHYKSHYWLASMYFHLDEIKDYARCRQFLLGPIMIPGCQVQIGLFQHRKPSNYFESIWRIPSDDITRSGSFSEHIFRSVVLLFTVLEKLRHCEALKELVVALQRKPVIDKHKYLREPDRQELLELASEAAERTFEAAYEKNSEETLAALYRLYYALYKMESVHKTRWLVLLKKFVARKLQKDVTELQDITALEYGTLMDRKYSNRAMIKRIDSSSSQLSAPQPSDANRSRMSHSSSIPTISPIRPNVHVARASEAGTSMSKIVSTSQPFKKSTPASSILPQPRYSGITPTKTTSVRPFGGVGTRPPILRRQEPGPVKASQERRALHRSLFNPTSSSTPTNAIRASTAVPTTVATSSSTIPAATLPFPMSQSANAAMQAYLEAIVARMLAANLGNPLGQGAAIPGFIPSSMFEASHGQLLNSLSQNPIFGSGTSSATTTSSQSLQQRPQLNRQMGMPSDAARSLLDEALEAVRSGRLQRDPQQRGTYGRGGGYVYQKPRFP